MGAKLYRITQPVYFLNDPLECVLLLILDVEVCPGAYTYEQHQANQHDEPKDETVIDFQNMFGDHTNDTQSGRTEIRAIPRGTLEHTSKALKPTSKILIITEELGAWRREGNWIFNG
jgi:hypothetical protein